MIKYLFATFLDKCRKGYYLLWLISITIVLKEINNNFEAFGFQSGSVLFFYFDLPWNLVYFYNNNLASMLENIPKYCHQMCAKPLPTIFKTLACVNVELHQCNAIFLIKNSPSQSNFLANLLENINK